MSEETDKPERKPAIRDFARSILWSMLCGLSACAGLAISYDPSDTVRRYVECFVIVTVICAGLDAIHRWRSR
jgi:hypothetical protein